MRLFVDTSALYALADGSDADHTRVAAVYEPRAEARHLVTADLVLAETWLLIRARRGEGDAKRFWKGVREGPLGIVYAGAGDALASVEILVP